MAFDTTTSGAGTSGVDGSTASGGSGLCFDKAGKCDNVVAFCNAAAGSTCELNTDLLGGLGGAGGGIPGLPGGSGGGTPAPNAGSCTCGTGGSSGTGGTPTEALPNSTCKQVLSSPLGAFTKLANCDCTKDAKNPDCTIQDILSGQPIDCCNTGSSGGGGGTPSDPITCLLSGMSGKPDPMCFGGITCSNLLSCMSGKPGGTCGSGLGL